MTSTVVVPVAVAAGGGLPWWIVGLLIGRDLVLAATLPLLRTRGLSALPVTYIGKAATFALMSGLPLVLLGQYEATWARIVRAGIVTITRKTRGDDIDAACGQLVGKVQAKSAKRRAELNPESLS